MHLPPALREKLAALPDKPGCYLMRDRTGTIIYVGKAVSLRRRVQSYFRPSTLRAAPPKLRGMLRSVADLDILTVRNEAEALLTESQLIKQYRPRFNVVLRDDKRYLALRADPREPVPRLATCRIVRADSAMYFGPFPSATVVRTVLDFTEKRYGLRKCTPLEPDAETYRHCINDIVRFCSAPCIGRISREAYRKRFDEACAFLRGERPAVIEEVRTRMDEASQKRDFEKAASLRDTWLALREMVRRRAITVAAPERHAEDARDGILDLQRRLGLPHVPARIEGFDISNLFGTHSVASMVVAVDGLPERRQYRRFRIRTVEGADDPRAIAEVIRRHYARMRGEHRPLPGLVLIDGGIPQLRAAREVLDTLGLGRVPTAGLAKRMEEIVLDNGAPPLRLPYDSPALRVLIRLRDEAHRFALDYHRRLRNRLIRESALDEIPGIGPAKKAALLRRFGSVYRLARASAAEVADVPGISPGLAEAILRAVDTRKTP
ncbi:MAG TPA: excinuclease ABC subunit UvrC [Kiritimatiellia bacterium]|jgi:excinuclease ABC subunit C|nr:excinuclease ABC subunit UvrC [Kiritimatiellia bacterium]HPK36861.1 excinuclease ABC subunit UvrC [Kiritimatiellia bacterium]HPW74418.1 excinuclease ABC subunit UvrC [Kiritimatiellia bacterium]